MSSTERPITIPVPTRDAIAAVSRPLAAALEGTGPAVWLHAPGSTVDPPDADLAPGTVAVVSTSGSSGIAKHVMLSASALRASAAGTDAALVGPGSWLLALPVHHVAGLQVIVRSLLAGTTPIEMDLRSGFTAAGFVSAVTRLGGTTRYVSLVPTQVTRLLEDERSTEALASFDAVLCGGSAISASVRQAAHDRGVRLVRTYGMTETCGGCVYDGTPLPGVECHIDNDGHVVLGGPVVASGYLGEPGLTGEAFHVDADGRRWFATQDLGHFQGGALVVTGRADDLINTGGVKVAPGPVEDALVRYLPEVSDAVVLGVPDTEWGEAVAAALVLTPRATRSPSVKDVRDALRGLLPDASLPRRVVILDAIPLRGPGKPDLATLRGYLAD